jgi:hypothetical protein
LDVAMLRKNRHSSILAFWRSISARISAAGRLMART